MHLSKGANQLDLQLKHLPGISRLNTVSLTLSSISRNGRKVLACNRKDRSSIIVIWVESARVYQLLSPDLRGLWSLLLDRSCRWLL